MRRVISVFLCAILLGSIFPTGTYADDSDAYTENAEALDSAEKNELSAEDEAKDHTEDEDLSDTELRYGENEVAPAGSPPDGEPVIVNNWDEIQYALNTVDDGGYISLGGNIVNEYKGDRIRVEGKSVTIDLAGHTLDRNNSSVKDNGHVIEVFDGATLTLTDSSSTGTDPGSGKITGGNSKRGGGIYVNHGGTLIIESGEISGNRATEYGGGIFVKGTLKMTGGVVTDNYAVNSGGGIHVDPKGKIELKNATVSRNQAEKTGGGIEFDQDDDALAEECEIILNVAGQNGGGLYLNASGRTLTLRDTDIAENSASSAGAGIYIHKGTVTMNGGSLQDNTSDGNGGGAKITNRTYFNAENVLICGNTAMTEGGGIKNYGISSLTDCKLIGNTAGDDGGGIYTKNDGDPSDLILTGCIISDNSSESHGGGIYCGKTATIDGGTIGEYADGSAGESYAGNSASLGGGMWIGSEASKVNIRGAVSMKGNTAEFGRDLYLREGKKLTLTGTIDGTDIGSIDMEEPGVFTDGYGEFHPASPSSVTPDPNDPKNHFCTDAGTIPVRWTNDKTEAEFASEWPKLQERIDNEAAGGTVELTEDTVASTADTRLKIRKNLTLDLAGYTLNRNLPSVTDDGHVIEVLDGATLIITDSSASGTDPGTGKITGGYSKRGGGIYVNEGCTLKIMSGAIAGNHATETGGGIYVKGTILTTGGSIRDNISDKEGGGLYLRPGADSTLEGITIAGNTSESFGGGLYMDSEGKQLNIRDAVIEDNSSGNDGGGLYLNKGKVVMTGGAVRKNTSSQDGGGVRVTGNTEFRATSAVISRNRAEREEGGGIKNHGTTVLSSCTVCENTAKNEGGGIYTKNHDEQSSLTLNGCIIYGNISGSHGGGVYIGAETTINGGTIGEYTDGESNAHAGNSAVKGGGAWVGTEAGNVNITGAIKMNGNAAEAGRDIYIRKDRKLRLKDRIDGTSIGSIDMEKAGIFTSGYSTYHSTDTPAFFFNTADGETPAEFTPDGKEAKLVSNWRDLQALITDAENDIGTGHVELAQDYRAIYSDDRLIVTKNVEIDLNGHKLDRNLAAVKDNGHVIEVMEGAELTISDSSASAASPGTGTITGGYSKRGGGIYVNEGGTLIIKGGSISGNHASEYGGGLYVKGKLQTTGVNIEDNISDEEGGGIYLKHHDDSSIGNCRISNNSSGSFGGGLYVDAEGRTITISGTDITLNNSDDDGAGIYLHNGTVTMNGGSLSSNVSHTDAGGAKITRYTSFTASDVSIRDNIAETEEGGGIKNYGVMVLTRCLITGNAALKQGGGICNYVDRDSESRLTLNDCSVAANRSDSEGGGIYSKKELTVNGGTVGGYTDTATGVRYNGNTAKKGGGIYISSEASDTYIKGALVVTGNSADDSGDNVFMRSGKKLTLAGTLPEECRIGVDLEDGVGVITENYRSKNGTDDPYRYFDTPKGYNLILNDSGEAELRSDWKILKSRIEEAKDGDVIKLENDLDKDFAARPSDNRIRIDGNKHITLDLNGHTVNRNRQSKTDDGHVFEVFGGSTLTVIDSSAQKTGTITGGWSADGGGIYIHENGTLNLSGGTITGNRGSTRAGGIYVAGTLNMTGGSVSDNVTDGNGGGIFIDDLGRVNLSGGTVTGNAAGKRGGGIMVGDFCLIRIKGGPVIEGNQASFAGPDIYLVGDNRLIVTGELDSTARIGVSLEKEWGIFTLDYVRFNSGKDPSRYFSSDESYSVVIDVEEAAMTVTGGGETEYEKPFLDRGDQVNPETDKLNSKNWMSGISGERRINEINMPGSHDSGMRNVIPLGFSDSTTAIASALSANCAWLATTQTHYINTQLADGARQLDLRLNNCYKKHYSEYDYNWADDGLNLWICHGANETTGTFQASGPDDEYLSLDQVLDWVKDFLKRHPTETVILNLRWEISDDASDERIYKIYRRARTILNRSALQINPSTGEPFLYKEPGSDDYFAAYKNVPKLKDCRGKILLQPSSRSFARYIGGFCSDKMFDYTAPADYSVNAAEQIEAIKNAYRNLNPDHDKYLPKDADTESDILWYWELNCTGESHGKYYIDAILGKLGSGAPLDYAAVVNPALIGKDKLFGERLNGQYIGWVRMDAFCAEYAEPIWRTNFFNDLEYCTVTVEPNLTDPNYAVQTYRVLKGSDIEIPGNIYKKLADRHFGYWKAEGAETDVRCNAGDSFRVNEDITFRAQWLEDGRIPARIIWKDGDDADKLRPGSVKVSIIEDGARTGDVTLTEDQGWIGEVPDTADAIVPDCSLIVPDADHPNGQDMLGQYRYEITRDSGGPVLTLYHTPTWRVAVNGTIIWEDNGNAEGIRPQSVTVHLFADGEETDPETGIAIEPAAASADGWNYDFGWRPQYVNGEKISYSVSEDGIERYSTMIDGFEIINTIVDQRQNVKNVNALVEWDDGGNVRDLRPESVRVTLLADGAEYRSQSVTESDFWAVSFKDVPATGGGQNIDYTIESEEVDGYTAAIEKLSDQLFRIKYTLEVDPGDKSPASVGTAPAAVNPEYSGAEQELVEGGSCNGGTLLYALGENDETAPTGGFSEEIPRGINAGKYYVWYKVKGDVFHTDTEALPVTASVAKRRASITVENAYKLQGDEDPAFTGEVHGLVRDGDIGDVEYSRDGDDEEAGRYEGVLDAEYTPSSNYDVTVEKGDFTIKEAFRRRWLNGDGSVLQERAYAEGDPVPEYAGPEPTKAATAQYTYDFLGWDSGTVEGLTTTFRPQFTETIRKYRVTFADYDGSRLKGPDLYDYGTVASSIIKPADPQRAADAHGTYTFTGWTPEIAAVTADAVYTAVYSGSAKYCTITWLQYDGTLIDRTQVEYGKKPVHADPSREPDSEYTYTFAGWTPDVKAATADATYKATYSRAARKGTLTFDLGGGKLDGKTGKITIEAEVGDVISLPQAPTRDGYRFRYWEGSRYDAGEQYKVEGDHAFTALWEKSSTEESKSSGGSDNSSGSSSSYQSSGGSSDTGTSSGSGNGGNSSRSRSSSQNYGGSPSTGGGSGGESGGRQGPYTGDDSLLILWIVMMALSLASIIITIKWRRDNIYNAEVYDEAQQ